MNKDLDYCCSSFLAYRYIFDRTKKFSKDFPYRFFELSSNHVLVRNENDLNIILKSKFSKIKNKKMALLLSGGMDSAVLARYMKGKIAYTFRFLNGAFAQDELKRAELFAKENRMVLHYIDISWKIIQKNLLSCCLSKGGPVHSIEPQLFEAGIQAKKDGVELLIIGDAADYVFGGMDKLINSDWSLGNFYKRFIYINPKDVLTHPVDVSSVLNSFISGKLYDVPAIIETISAEESYASYENAFHACNINYIDPYENLKMESSLDVNKIRRGESKYIIRNLFKMLYPEIEVPNKNPMPRPVDKYFENWKGPSRKEFLPNINISLFNGNQKWLLYCLEYYLNFIDKASQTD